jgi:hypothetical protein
MNITTIRRHFLSAVCVLGTSEGSIVERLRAAYRDHLSPLSGNSALPEYMRDDYEKLMAELGELLGGREDIDTRRAARAAKRIVVLYDRVTKP